jgi:hypothetical protein
MEIQLVDSNVGIPEDRMRGLLSQGWMVVPKVTVGPNLSKIAVPGSMPPGARVVDMWVSPAEPMIPLSFVAGSLVALKNQGDGDWVTLDKLSRAFFGRSLKELEKHVSFAQPVGGQEDGEGRPGDTSGEGPGDPEAEVLQFPSAG